MKKRTLAILMILLACLSGCNSMHYKIEFPKSKSIKNIEAEKLLSKETIKLIEQYIPMSIEWYNSIDASQPISRNFVNSEFEELIYKVRKTPEVEDYERAIKEYKYVPYYVREAYSFMKPILEIDLSIAAVISTATPELSFNHGDENFIKVNERKWLELRKSIDMASYILYSE